MKKQDLFFAAGVLVFFLPFFLFPEVYQFYERFNREHGMWTSFIKFALLATTGESIGLRIRIGHYNQPGFGLLPRAIVWGLLGLTIKLAFVIFSSGTVTFLQYMGMKQAGAVMLEPLSMQKIFVAFCISLFMNTIYAPVMMTFHKITDTHIVLNGGTLDALIKPIRFADMFSQINWKVQWGFVFKKTIPFFWIPAHTLTFLLPADYQVLFAALLSVVLGVFLAVASLKGQK
ncbi:MAG: Mpv17/PMP22 family protein [Bacteroidales bacterium]